MEMFLDGMSEEESLRQPVIFDYMNAADLNLNKTFALILLAQLPCQEFLVPPQ